MRSQRLSLVWVTISVALCGDGQPLSQTAGLLWFFLGFSGKVVPVLRSVSSRVLRAASLASFSDAVKLGGSLLVPSRESCLRVNLSLRRKICAS
jgi:hypothetical protein